MGLNYLHNPHLLSEPVENLEKIISALKTCVIECAKEDLIDENNSSLATFKSAFQEEVTKLQNLKLLNSSANKLDQDKEISDLMNMYSSSENKLANEAKQDYNTLKAAIRKEQEDGISKYSARVLTSLVVGLLHASADIAKFIGDLIKHIPVAGYAIDRIPGISYEGLERSKDDFMKTHFRASERLRRNFMHGIGGALQTAGDILEEFSNPSRAAAGKIVNKEAKRPSRWEK
ncbi:MAG: hypothetical protein SFT93_05830 [Rickettsiaceae bacterium]|nr:hypothetical protein [Rickettsiaceae bacterium]